MRVCACTVLYASFLVGAGCGPTVDGLPGSDTSGGGSSAAGNGGTPGSGGSAIAGGTSGGAGTPGNGGAGGRPAGTGGTAVAGATGSGGIPGAGGSAQGGVAGSGGMIVIPPLVAKCKVSVGRYHTCAVKTDGNVFCWGRGDGGECGPAGGASTLSPVAIPGISDVADIVAGYYASYAIKKDGSLWAWGGNPRRLDNGPIAQFAAGWGHKCLLRPNGTLWCWGVNDYGQVGNGTQTTSSGGVPAPTQVLDEVVQVTTGHSYTCALKKTGTVWCWGINVDGWLGIGKNSPYETRPQEVTALGNEVVQVSMENAGACALKKDGTVWCWWGTVGSHPGNQGSSTGLIAVAGSVMGPSPGGLPVKLDGLSEVVFITIGKRNACALKTDGSLWCWGPWGNVTRTPSMVQSLGKNVVQVSTRYRHICATTNDGVMWCWGNNASGEVGDGTNAFRTVPWRVKIACN